MKDIETLLNKYFEGETTCEEERRLRRFFAEGLVPEHLEVYRPMFAFFEAEQEELTEVSGQCNAGEMPELAIFEKKTKTVRKYLTYSLGAAAAALLLLLGISGIYRHISPAPANYVIIDGKEYTDVHLIREQAMVAFRDVSLSEEEIFATLFDEQHIIMMNKIIRTTLIALLLTFAAHAAAQQGLQIATVFQKYGKQKGVTMVELSNEMLETYQMTLYKSLVFKDVNNALPTILRCLEADKKKAKKVKEVVSNGQIKSGYYQLPQLKEDVNRFILFKTGKKDSATLIYIEGELDADDLITMLFMKKE